MAKRFRSLDITDTALGYTHNDANNHGQATLRRDLLVRSSLDAGRLDAAAVVNACQGMKVVEADFRSLKTIDLDLRPIRHWTTSAPAPTCSSAIARRLPRLAPPPSMGPDLLHRRRPPPRTTPSPPPDAGPQPPQRPRANAPPTTNPPTAAPPSSTNSPPSPATNYHASDATVEILATPTTLQRKEFEASSAHPCPTSSPSARTTSQPTPKPPAQQGVSAVTTDVTSD